MKLLGIMLGAVIGASARYFVGGAIASRMKGPFPLGTLAINLTGCLIIGALWGFAERFGWSPTLRAFLFIGILGSYTTFSSFGLETLALLKAGQAGQALLYLLASNIGGLALVWLGLAATGSNA